MILIITSILIVIALVAYQGTQSAERKPGTEKAVLVDIIEAKVVSLNFSVNSQGTVRPRTETTLVSEVSGKKLIFFTYGTLFVIHFIVIQSSLLFSIFCLHLR